MAARSLSDRLLAFADKADRFGKSLDRAGRGTTKAGVSILGFMLAIAILFVAASCAVSLVS